MTDHPRFEPIRDAPHEAHLHYNGGRLVDAVLRLIDWWLAARETTHPARGFMRAMPTRARGNMRGTEIGLLLVTTVWITALVDQALGKPEGDQTAARTTRDGYMVVAGPSHDGH